MLGLLKALNLAGSIASIASYPLVAVPLTVFLKGAELRLWMPIPTIIPGPKRHGMR
jgi:hypothetical protein